MIRIIKPEITITITGCCSDKNLHLRKVRKLKTDCKNRKSTKGQSSKMTTLISVTFEEDEVFLFRKNKILPLFNKRTKDKL